MPKDADPTPPELRRLRERLYAPDATEADQHRYRRELARSARRTTEDPEAPAGRTAPPRSTTAGHRARMIAAGAGLLVAGLVLGSLVTLQLRPAATAAPAAPATSADSAPSARSSVEPGSAPRPLVAAALGSPADQRDDRRVLAAALRLSPSAARATAITTIGVRRRFDVDAPWMRRTGCTQWSGDRNFSPNGLRSDLRAGTGASKPFGTHFRLKIYMAAAADWTWVASGRSEDGDAHVVALGAGSSGAGSSQYAEFDTVAATTITSIDVRTSPGRPFVWDVDSCTTP